MVYSLMQEKYNNSIVTALLFNTLPLTEKEIKLQRFISEHEERYDVLCDNIHTLHTNKTKNLDADTLYLTIEGFSFLSNSFMDPQPACFPVLTINQYSPDSPDISMYIEIALNHFVSYCEFAKSTIRAVDQSA